MSASDRSANDEVRYRKIHPIYQAIDGQNYKSAIKLCQRKDIQNWDIAKALQAYCLVMCHKVDEGLALAREVKENHPTDESVLSALALTFRHGKVEEECCECYENAYTARPDNHGIATELFACYAKCGEFKKMQQLSQKLYKTTSDPKYIFWTVSSILHQLDSLPVTMLDLAEKMIMKIFGDRSISKGTETPGAEELKLLVEILRKRAAHPSTTSALKCELLERALHQIRELSSRPSPAPINDNTDYTQDPSIVKSHPTHIKILCIDVLKDLHHYQTSEDSNTSEADKTSRILEANESVLPILREVLLELPDQWDVLEALVTVHLDSYSRSKTLGDSRLGELRRDLLQMQSLQPENRGPYLAEMLLLRLWIDELRSETREGETKPSPVLLPQSWNQFVDQNRTLPDEFSRMNLFSDPQTMEQEMIRLVAQYILKFETKQCCFTDIRPYLTCFDSKENSQFIDWIQTRIGEIRLNLLTTIQRAQIIPSEDAGKDVPDQLCQLSKLLQIDYHLKVFNSQEMEANSWQFTRSLVDLYCVTHEVAGGKGVGGLREVQPGDELLMLASTVMKRQLLALRTVIQSSHEATSEQDQEAELTRLSLNWAVLLGIGREKSPHSYCFTVELLEPLRYLTCSQYALELFNTLGVRYIQLDSMSYLILAALVEGGLFTEMTRLSRNIVGFHESARKDTLASVAKSFTFCNYAKGLELGEFCNRCQQSTQLALSRAEVPIFEGIDRLSNVQALSTYLQGYVAHMHLESQTELTDEKMNRLVDNMDYGLLTRVDENPFTGGEKEKKIRRAQYERRIMTSQSLLRVIFSTLQNDFSTASSKINLFFSQIWEHSSAAAHSPVENPFGLVVDHSSSSSSSSYAQLTNESLLWSQQISSGMVDDNFFEQKNLDAILRICALTITAIQLDQSTKASTEENTNAQNEKSAHLRETLQQISRNLHSIFIEIRTILGEGVGTDTTSSTSTTSSLQSRYLDSECILLRPSWIRKVSCFSRNLATWGAIILSHLEGLLLNKKKKAKKGAKTVPDFEERALLVNVIQDIKILFTLLDKALDRHSDPDPSDVLVVAEFIRRSCQSLVEGGAEGEVSETTKGAVEESIRVLAKQLLSSQRLVCSRLRETIRNKKSLLETS